MTYSEKLSDIIALGKCSVHYTNSQYSFCISQKPKFFLKKEHTAVKILRVISKFNGV